MVSKPDSCHKSLYLIFCYPRFLSEILLFAPGFYKTSIKFMELCKGCIGRLNMKSGIWIMQSVITCGSWLSWTGHDALTNQLDRGIALNWPITVDYRELSWSSNWVTWPWNTAVGLDSWWSIAAAAISS